MRMSMISALAGALSLAALPLVAGVAQAQEPPSAPSPSDAGSSMSKGEMGGSKGGMMMKKHSMKKKKKMHKMM